MRKGKGAPIFSGFTMRSGAAGLVRSSGRLWLVLVVDWAPLHSLQQDSGQQRYTISSEGSPIAQTANRSGKYNSIFDS